MSKAIEMSNLRKIVKCGERFGLAGLLAVIAYTIVGILLSLVTVNGQPDSGGDVVAYMGDPALKVYAQSPSAIDKD